ncbi:OTU-like cysteine protease [Diplonema papillatum]|nr:OTU-like cysteine protease [Diplonema papillatum]
METEGIEETIQRIRDESALKEDALTKEIERVNAERWLSTADYPAHLRRLERENSKMRVELELQRGLVVNLGEEVGRLRDQLRQVKMERAHDSGVLDLQAEVAATAHMLGQATRELQITSGTLMAQVQPSRHLGEFPTAVKSLATGEPTAMALSLEPSRGVNATLYAKFLPPNDSEPLDYQPVQHDGNTLWRSVAWALFGDETHFATIRTKVVEHLSANPAMYSQYLTRSMAIHDYTARIEATGGDLVSLQAAANLYRAGVYVYLLPEKRLAHLVPAAGEPLVTFAVAMWLEGTDEMYCPVTS